MYEYAVSIHASLSPFRRSINHVAIANGLLRERRSYVSLVSIANPTNQREEISDH